MRYLAFLFLTFLLSSLLGSNPSSLAQEDGEDTYSISLVQTAEADKEKEIVEVDDRKVLAETYKIRSGDHLWQLLRERGLLEKRNLQELLYVLKQLNASLTNLDLLHPGETIVIPLTIAPSKAGALPAPKAPGPPVPLEKLKDVDLQQYTVQPGDTLIKVIRNAYNVTDKEIYDEYLDLLKRMNPALKDPNTIFPGQKIRLPIYSPQVVRMPIQEAPPSVTKPEPEPTEDQRVERADLLRQLSELFREMGVEWMTAGQHFIPLKSGGQINLNAGSFPIVSLSNGHRVVVDLYHSLPPKMADLITSSWDNYQIVQIQKDDGLRAAMRRILQACGFQRIYPAGEPVELAGDFSVRLRGDWVLQMEGKDSTQQGRFMIITLLDAASPRTPLPLKGLLEKLGVKVVEYPTLKEAAASGGEVKALPQRASSNPEELVEEILRAAGLDFSKGVEIPIYQERKKEFNLVLKADFLLRIEEKESVIDLSGMGTEIVSLLAERQYRILSLPGESRPYALISRVLEFSGIAFDPNPHPFLAAERGESRNILITVPGITFSGRDRGKVFVTGLDLPDELGTFLSKKGYQVLVVGSQP